MSAPDWRITVHRRSFTVPPEPASATGVGEIVDARSRRLEIGWNTPAKLSFTVDGRSPAAAEVLELATECMAWRDGTLMFRGVVTQSEDTVSEQAHTVNFACHDYLAILTRRFLTPPAPLVYTQTDQDTLVADLVNRANTTTSGNGATSFVPGSRLPLVVRQLNPDGTARAALSGQLRDRTYEGQTSIGQAITDLAGVINSYDVDVWSNAGADGYDWLRLWYPSRGVTRNDMVLQYGATVASFTRAVNSTDYANYWRALGNQTTQGAPQMYADRWNADANNVSVTPVGLWPDGSNESDVSVQATLNDKAAGALNTAGVLVPSYTLALRPGAPIPNLGDTVPLLIRSGRLNVTTTIRVLAINYAISDDADELVELTVGRPVLTLTSLFVKQRRDIDALARR